MRLSARSLNRTLLHRQQLLERGDLDVVDVCRRLLGLQAQEGLSPFLALHARLRHLDPYEVNRGLAERRLVRLLTLRGTIHLLAPEDALTLRPWVQSHLDRQIRSNQSTRSASEIDRAEFVLAVRDLLVDGSGGQKELAAALAVRFPDCPGTALGHLARLAVPLAQMPPRGGWKVPGGVAYQVLGRWLGRDLLAPDVTEIARRYLRAFGPATAADLTAWSGVTRLGPVLNGMADLVRHEDQHGTMLLDVPEGVLIDEEAPAPVRLLGRYDNLWLAHAGKDRVTTAETRGRWMGANGGTANTLFVDGWLTGLWRAEDGRVRVSVLFRELTRTEQQDLEAEIARVELLLAR